MNREIISEEKRALTVFDYISIFVRWKRYILISTIIVGIVAIILYYFVFKLIFLSTATIKSSGKSVSLLGSFEALSELGGLDELTGLKSAKELSAYEEIISSRRCLEPLIVKFDLMNKDEFDYMEDAVKSFRESKLYLKQDKESSVLYVGVYDESPSVTKEMVEFLVSELDKINIELNIQKAKSNREFIEHRYLQAKEDLANAEDTLKDFQYIYGISPELQVRASAQVVFGLESELKAEEVKLDVLKNILSSDQPEVKTLETKVNSMKSKIAEIQSSTDLSDLLRLGNSPQIVMSFLRLQRNVEIQTKILTFLLPIYEQTKIEEKKNTPTILILDKPYVPERKAKPKRFSMVILSIFGTLFLTFLSAVLYETFLRPMRNRFKQLQSH